jgi:hypothetical protein
MRKNRTRKDHPLNALLREVRRGNLHPEVGLEKQVFPVRLSTSQLKGLNKLAHESGTTVREQMDRAIDAYLLGVSRQEITVLHALLARLEHSTARADKALDEAFREMGMTAGDFAKKHRGAPPGSAGIPTKKRKRARSMRAKHRK